MLKAENTFTFMSSWNESRHMCVRVFFFHWKGKSLMKCLSLTSSQTHASTAVTERLTVPSTLLLIMNPLDSQLDLLASNTTDWRIYRKSAFISFRQKVIKTVPRACNWQEIPADFGPLVLMRERQSQSAHPNFDRVEQTASHWHWWTYHHIDFFFIHDSGPPAQPAMVELGDKPISEVGKRIARDIEWWYSFYCDPFCGFMESYVALHMSQLVFSPTLTQMRNVIQPEQLILNSVYRFDRNMK